MIPTLLTPGQVHELTIDLGPRATYFYQGTVCVSKFPSNFPRFDRNLNTGEDQATGTGWQIAAQTIFHDQRYPSHILLPVIPR
jgi:predicted acyl esterase